MPAVSSRPALRYKNGPSQPKAIAFQQSDKQHQGNPLTDGNSTKDQLKLPQLLLLGQSCTVCISLAASSFQGITRPSRAAEMLRKASMHPVWYPTQASGIVTTAYACHRIQIDGWIKEVLHVQQQQALFNYSPHVSNRLHLRRNATEQSVLQV